MLTRITQPYHTRISFLFGALAIAVGGVLGLTTNILPHPLLPIIALVGVGVCLTIVLKPEWGLIVFVFIIYARVSDVLVNVHNLPSLAKPFIGFLVMVLAVRWIVYKEPPNLLTRGTLIVLAYGLIGISSFLYAESSDHVVEALSLYVRDALVAIIIIALLQRANTLTQVIWTLLVVGIFLGTLATIQQLSGELDNNYWGFAQTRIMQIVDDAEDAARIGGPGLGPNGFAQIILMLVPLALDRFWSEKKFLLRLLAGWALGATVLTVIFTFSRGAFMGLILVLGLMYVSRPPKPIISVITIIMIVVISTFLPENYTERVVTLKDFLPGSENDVTEEVSFRGRLSENISAIMMFEEHPLLGVGLYNFRYQYQSYSRQLGLDNRRIERAPHSLYLEIASQLGLVGLGWFALLQWFTLSGLWQAQKDFTAAGLLQQANMSWAFSFTILSFLVTGIFLHLGTPRYFWMIYGIALVIPRIAKQELKNKLSQDEISLGIKQ